MNITRFRPVKRLVFAMVRVAIDRDTGWSHFKLTLLSELCNAMNQRRQRYVRFKDRRGGD